MNTLHGYRECPVADAGVSRMPTERRVRLVTIACLLAATVCTGSSRAEPLQFTVSAGIRTQFADARLGSQLDARQEQLGADNAHLEHDYRAESPLTGSFEIRVSRAQGDHLSWEAGLGLMRTGSRYSEFAVYRDPLVQYDRYLSARRHSTASQLAFPVGVAYRMSDTVEGRVGLIAAFSLNAEVPSTTTVSGEAVINGQRANEQGLPELTESLDIPTRGFVPGAYAGVAVRIGSSQIIDFGAFMVRQPLLHDELGALVCGCTLGIGYRFPQE
ncbi:MAG: hypothetical protein IPK64_18380 [bacterium]|nr:hypothetical protein [bacterium]